jgi:hypothetical protein
MKEGKALSRFESGLSAKNYNNMEKKCTVEQAKIMNDILENLKKGINEKGELIPAGWDGFEIRQWIADYFNANFVIPDKLNGKRKKLYKSALYNHQLL